MQEIVLKNPNKALVKYGLLLIIFYAVAYYAKAYNLVLGILIVVKILAIIWLPKAAQYAGRNRIFWTIIGAILTSISLIVLGFIGIKKSDLSEKIILKYNELLNQKINNLTSQTEGKQDDEQIKIQIKKYIEELSEKAYNEYTEVIFSEDYNYLNNQLEKKGFILEPKPDQVAEVTNRCPACGCHVSINDQTCPECGLTFQ